MPRFSAPSYSSAPMMRDTNPAPSFAMPVPTVVESMESSAEQPIFVIDNCFLVTPHNNKLLVIDQHAAHERILYNQIWSRDAAHPLPSQTLLVPIPLELSESEMALLDEQQEAFSGLGFAFADQNGERYLKSVPQLVKHLSPMKFLHEVLRGLNEDRPEPELKDTKHKFYATMACKAAVKAGDMLDESEKQQLVRDLLTLPDVFTCPHGRPTHIEIAASQLEKLFKRTGF
jgi:DNA mismatch repair protein MutL